ncbi:YecA family protein [Brevibacillus sp. BC25]|uniref:YecA family protein n=1 Tax=Brevibacillus sp. BC25 TaxID=1144308 RepID=UPI000270E571|nr:SEC-C metal-binding domain-containing protein [Brevibacillus sp. BC25]EJL29091.1 SEC-C motif domain protein [Brevibacillus sp. BC25]
MVVNELKEYLQKFRGTTLNPDIPNILKELKRQAVGIDDQAGAKEIWCIEQVYKILGHYISAFKCLKIKKHFDAWNQFDRADIELSFLKKHFDYSNNKYNLLFIETNIVKFQKLFPYQYFSSRESLIKSEKCSICGQKVTLRRSCDHKVGEIYNGEQCCRNVEDVEFLGIAIVENPFDKYGVLFPQGMEYNYRILDSLMEHLKSPYEKWDLEITKELKDEYKGVGRNQKCPCNSGEKYKKCCYRSGKDRYDHNRITFLEKNKNFQKPIERVHTWK